MPARSRRRREARARGGRPLGSSARARQRIAAGPGKPAAETCSQRPGRGTDGPDWQVGEPAWSARWTRRPGRGEGGGADGPRTRTSPGGTERRGQPRTSPACDPAAGKARLRKQVRGRQGGRHSYAVGTEFG